MGHNGGGSSHLPSITIKPIDVHSVASAAASSNSSLNQSASISTPTNIKPTLPPPTPIKPPQSAQIPSDQCQTVRFKSLPLQLLTPTSGGADSKNDYLEASIHRWIQVPLEKLDLINLSSSDERPENSENESGPPIFIEAPQLDEFLPGDQLIAIEDFSMIGITLIAKCVFSYS